MLTTQAGRTGFDDHGFEKIADALPHMVWLTDPRGAATYHNRIKVVRSGGLTTWPAIWLPRMQAYVESGNVRAALRLLRVLIPEYLPSDLVVTAAGAREAAQLDEGEEVLAIPA